MAREVSKRPSRKEMLGANNVPSVSQLRVMETFVRQERDLTAKIADLEAQLSEAKTAHHKITHEEIPEAMMAAGVSSFKTEAGLTVEVADFVTGSLPKAELDEGKPRAKALDWLRNNDAEGIIKTTISLTFGKGENKRADALRTLLRKNGFKEFADEIGVHPQTLGAFAREALRKGKKLPLKTLGIFLDHKAVVREPKPKKEKGNE